MAFLSIFTLVLLSLADVQPVILLTQSAAEVKKPGETIRLSCKPSGYTLTCCSVHWVRKIPGKGLEWIGYQIFKGGSGYHQSFQGIFTISEDVSLTTTYLQINSLRAEDTAMYYCTRGVQGGTVKQLNAKTIRICS
uniref:Ig-like domain-containing protein n=1 Tax=Latimeria chalumnae TaxID=7897 RepID=H2ZRV9_LATCH